MNVRVAVCQILCIDGDREGNFRRIEYALEQAVAEGADMAAFPESVILGWENPDAHRMATPIPGEDSDRVAALARKYDVMISIGLDEKDGEKLYGAAILVDRFGQDLVEASQAECARVADGAAVFGGIGRWCRGRGDASSDGSGW